MRTSLIKATLASGGTDAQASEELSDFSISGLIHCFASHGRNSTKATARLLHHPQTRTFQHLDEKSPATGQNRVFIKSRAEIFSP
ncbi:hypothetical protein CEP88_08110 [Roseobacter denitrificans]|nr:hypothetical protein CEP88_08110 [Roseobacter denitrificans]